MIYKKFGTRTITVVFFLACSTNVLMAQNVQNFVNNEENNIQQDASMGALNAKQTSALQNKQAQIMYQEQQDKNQNGGNLTQQEQRQIAGEERGLTRGVNRDVYQNNPNIYQNNMNAGNFNNGLQNRPYAGWNQNNMNGQSQPGWSNFFNRNQNNNINNQPGQYNGQPYRHHRQWQGQNQNL